MIATSWTGGWPSRIRRRFARHVSCFARRPTPRTPHKRRSCGSGGSASRSRREGGGGPMMLDDVLERGLTDAADDYDIPSGALERVREQLAPPATEPRTGDLRRPSRLGWRPSGNAWMGMAAAAVIVLIAVPIAIGGSGSNGSSNGGESAGSAAVLPASKPASGGGSADGGTVTSNGANGPVAGPLRSAVHGTAGSVLGQSP